MSPKKAHEIVRMSAYLSKLLAASPELVEVEHAVDVGAGQVRELFLRAPCMHGVLCLSDGSRPLSLPYFQIVRRCPWIIPLILSPNSLADPFAKQAYLSRAMRDQLGLHVLALDWSDVQSKGASRREMMGPKKWKNAQKNRTKPSDVAFDATNEATEPKSKIHESKGSLAYKILKVRSDSLLRAVDEWSEEMRMTQVSNDSPPPMLFVALHACGSLTPNLLRAFISRVRENERKESWHPRAAVIVGCCYNLLEVGGEYCRAPALGARLILGIHCRLPSVAKTQ